jgi:hypothetical protein
MLLLFLECLFEVADEEDQQKKSYSDAKNPKNWSPSLHRVLL